MAEQDSTPTSIKRGLCLCGCGEPTRIATKTSAARCIFRGQPLRYVDGHQGRKPKSPPKACMMCGAMFAPKEHVGSKEYSARKFCSVRCVNRGFTAPCHPDVDLLSTLSTVIRFGKQRGKRPLDLFLSRVGAVGANGCRIWSGCINSTTGYGYMKVGSRRVWAAHRIAYVLARGEIPAGLELDHLCRIRACVNPDHLEPVTHQENVLRGESPPAAQAKRTHCKNGHDYSTHARIRRNKRECRLCVNANQRLRYRDMVCALHEAGRLER